MKKNVSQYLQVAKRQAMEGYNSADGFIDNDLSFTGEDFFNVEGSAQSAQHDVTTSQPYIVNVTSTSGAIVNDFAILGSNQYLYDGGFNANGDLVIGAVTISSGISGVTYREMLAQFQTNPFSVGMTYISSPTATQILQPISVNTRDANGNTAQKVMPAVIDPYQNQNNVLVMKYPYRIDGFTKLIIRQLLPTAYVSFYLYPADNINLARALGGKAVSKQFGTPPVVNGQTIKLSV